MTSLYIHVPFCQKKCFYCSFVVSVGQENRIDDYLGCLNKEAHQYRGVKVKTVYIGGGTPTLMHIDQLKRMIDMIHHQFEIPTGVEWTIEANPENLSVKKIKVLKKLGVNRFSLGVQSLNDQFLQYLGRNHNRNKVMEAYQILREAHADNINLDLMFSFPDQSEQDIQLDLNEIVDLGSEHVSLYSLMIEQNSRFYSRDIKLNDDHDQAEKYLSVKNYIEKNGFKQYEISNFAKTGFESRHNINYWNGGNYIGLGVGAHSHLNGMRYWNKSKLLDYMFASEKNESVVESREVLNKSQRYIETLLFGLRMNQGVALNELYRQFGVNLDYTREAQIQSFIDLDYLILEDGYLKATEQGRLILDEIAARLV